MYVIAGTKLKYMPGVIQGGKGLEHDCGVHRGIGYFLEPLILLGLFAKAPISIRLKGEASLVCATVLQSVGPNGVLQGIWLRREISFRMISSWLQLMEMEVFGLGFR